MLLNKIIKTTKLSISAIVLVVVLIGINYLSYRYFARLDLTENKIYSISDASKKIVGELEDTVEIKAYFSVDLPSQFAYIRQETEDILNEYENYGKGKIKFEFTSPDDSNQTFNDLAMMGIYPIPFQIFEKDKAQAGQGYMALVMNYKENEEAIPAVGQDTGDLEYRITAAIKKVTNDKIIKVGFLSGAGTAILNEKLRYAGEMLSELYDVGEVVFTDEGLSPQVDTLIIAGPTEEFTEDQFKNIDSFLTGGGSLLVLSDGVLVSQSLEASLNNSNFNDLLNKYGIKINGDLVGDTRMGLISYRQGNLPFSVVSNYPLWPKIMKDGFNENFGAVSNLENVILPWVSSVSADEEKIGKENISYLIFTTEKAWHETDQFNVDPSIGISLAEGRYNLAVAVNNGLKSVYPEEGKEDDVISGRVVIVGDSDFVVDGFLMDNPQNLILFQNLVDNLSMGNELTGIRAKNATVRPINKGEELSDAKRNFIRYGNIFGASTLVIIFGLGRYFARRRKKFEDDL
ncbi:MAG: GldG family protein [bacterium]